MGITGCDSIFAANLSMKNFYLFIFLLLSTYASATAPTTPASSLSFNAIEGSYLNIAWHAGNGTRRVIIAKAGSPVTFKPQNGVDYTENTVFGSGQQVAPGEYVIYDNAFTSFYLTGLTPGAQYYFAVFEYNGTGATTEYLLDPYLSGSGFTAAVPTTQASNLAFSNITATTVKADWTNGNGARRLILCRQGSPVTADPADLHTYSANGSFGSGGQAGAGNYAVYSNSGTNTVISNLQPGTTYYFSVYEFNGSGEPVYMRPALTGSVTTRSIPTIPSSDMITVLRDGKELAFNWTKGNGERRIMVAKKGTNITGIPQNGIDYTENENFGSGQAIGSGEFVVYDGTGISAYVYNLDPASVYYFKIFEYDGTGTNALYLTSTFAAASASTVTTPAIQVSAISATNIQGNSLKLVWTKGDGASRLVVARKGSPVNITPQDFKRYVSNSDFGSGEQIGSGNFVLNNTQDELMNVRNLEANTVYHFALYEFNGQNQPLYLRPPVVFNVSTLAALPVKLSEWKLLGRDNAVRLQWTTETEENASHFIVQQSADGVNFTTLTRINATGNSQIPVHYAVEDKFPFAGKNYYRLQMVDIDGRIEYSSILSISVTAPVSAARLINNPVSDKMIVLFSAGTKSNWRIINVSGQVVASGVAVGRTEINSGAWRPGHYWLQIQDGKKEAISFVKQ